MLEHINKFSLSLIIPQPNCTGQMTKYDFQKESRKTYLERTGYKNLIHLKKRRFRCEICGKMAVSETSLVKKKHQIISINNQIAKN